MPSADCLSQLDFVEFKKSKKVTAPKKAVGGGGASQSPGAMEPIFKKLTDEIKSLQTSLSVQEQYNKMSSSCYQRVLLDLITETERIKMTQNDRLSRLEEQFQQSQSSSLAKLSRWLARAIVQVSKWSVLAMKTICEWSISYLYYISSMIAVWILSLFQLYITLPRILLSAAIPWWPKIKRTILATASGSNFVERVLPMIIRIDRLMEEQRAMDLDLDNIMKSATGRNGGGEEERMGQRSWIFPVLPLALCLCLIRIVMCFSSNPDPSPSRMIPQEVAQSPTASSKASAKSINKNHHGRNSNGSSSNATPSSISTAASTNSNGNNSSSNHNMGSLRSKRRNSRRYRPGRKPKRNENGGVGGVGVGGGGGGGTIGGDDDDDDHDHHDDSERDHHLSVPELIESDVRSASSSNRK